MKKNMKLTKEQKTAIIKEGQKMIIDTFIQYGISENQIRQAINDTDFSDRYFWGNYEFGFYDNKLFVLFGYNRFHGSIVRQIAYIQGDRTIKREAANGDIIKYINEVLQSSFDTSWNSVLTKTKFEKKFSNILK